MLIDDLDSVPHYLTQGTRGVMLLRRNKDGQEGNAQRHSIKRITQNTEEWKAAVLELREIQKNLPSHRIYSSVNARNMIHAIREFRRRQLECEFGSDLELEAFYVDIKNRFFSCLMNPNARNVTMFLIDCDSDEEYKAALNQLDGKVAILFDYPTKNGRHLITEPFNPNKFDGLQIKKDDLVYIG